MGLFRIDQSLCEGEGLCAQICSAGLIAMVEDKPTASPDAEDRCTLCGHCVAVCPTGAFSLSQMQVEKCPPVQPDLFITEVQMVNRMRSRRSIRHFSSKPPERDVVKRLLDAARYAPSNHNYQPVEFLVVEGRTAVQRLSSKVLDWMRFAIDHRLADESMQKRYQGVIATCQSGKDRILRNAPVLIIAHAPRELYASRPASLIALSYAELAAPSFGLGVCWAGYFMIAAENYPPLRDILEIPRQHEPYGAMMAGIPMHTFHRLPQRKPLRITWQV